MNFEWNHHKFMIKIFQRVRPQLVLGQCWGSYHPSKAQLEYSRLTWYWLGDQLYTRPTCVFLAQPYRQFLYQLCCTSCLRERLCTFHIVVHHWRDHVAWHVVCRWYRSHCTNYFQSLSLSFWSKFQEEIHLQKQAPFHILDQHCVHTSKYWIINYWYSFFSTL